MSLFWIAVINSLVNFSELIYTTFFVSDNLLPIEGLAEQPSTTVITTDLFSGVFTSDFGPEFT